MVAGARLTISYIRIGGVWKDLPPAFLSHLQDLVDLLPGKFDEYETMLTAGPLWQERLEGIGRLSREEAINMGLTGPILRGSGVDWDLRRDMPYSGYENCDLTYRSARTATATGATSSAWRRCAKARYHHRRWRTCPTVSSAPTTARSACPPRRTGREHGGADHHFKLMTEGFGLSAWPTTASGQQGRTRLRLQRYYRAHRLHVREELQQPLRHQQDVQMSCCRISSPTSALSTSSWEVDR